MPKNRFQTRCRMVGLQSGEGRMMTDSVVWAQYIKVTDTQTATQPRRHSNSRPSALRRAARSRHIRQYCSRFIA